jgi:flagellar motility protein MotE (MotC chaperone)
MSRSSAAVPVTRRILASGATAACAFCFVAAAATIAGAQGWEPTVSAGSLPAREPATPRPLVAQKYRSAQVAPAALPPSAPEPGEKAPSKDSPAPVRKSAQAPKDYCINIVDAAADARVAWQRKMIAGAEAELDKRIALLEEKTAEYKKWLARRDEFTKKANETVLKIYARMRPDAAAMQLVVLDEETADAVLTKLEPRLASLILNDMDPAHAAKLTSTIIGSGKVLPSPTKSAKVEAGK